MIGRIFKEELLCMDAEMTALNCITAIAPQKARIPMVLPSYWIS
jgi:hypothetical protein